MDFANPELDSAFLVTTCMPTGRPAFTCKILIHLKSAVLNIAACDPIANIFTKRQAAIFFSTSVLFSSFLDKALRKERFLCDNLTLRPSQRKTLLIRLLMISLKNRKIKIEKT